MNKFRLTIKLLAIATFMVAFASLTQAQATRTWVSGVGDDANPCSRTAPCKTFAGAISKTANGGEIDALDPGGFGAVTITKNITIDGTGTFASILASGVQGVIINGNDVLVRLRGLSINGAGTTPGTNGINFINGAGLWVEDTVIDGFTTAGINITSSFRFNELHVRNTVIRNCGDGIRISNSAGFGTGMSLDNVNVSRCTNGLDALNGVRGGISKSFFGQNSSVGIRASQTTDNTNFTVSDTAIVGLGITAGGTGINVANANSRVAISRTIVTQYQNALGLTGVVDTGGNNTIMGNGTDQAPNGNLSQQK